MAAKKLSEITHGTPNPGDFVVGVTATNQDRLFPAGTASTSITINTTSIIGGGDEQILFNKAGVVSSDANLIWDYTNERLGIGAAPAFTIDINGTVGVEGKAGLYTVPNVVEDNWFEGGSGNMTLTGSGNYGTGSGALSSLTSGVRNMAVGSHAQRDVKTGSYNTGIGASALLMNNGSENTGIGLQALQNVTTGNNNIAIGVNSGNGLIDGLGNTFIGTDGTGNAIVHGSQNLALGYDADFSGDGTGQITISNMICGTGCTGVGSTLSTGWIGIGVRSAYTTEVFGVNGTICTNSAAFMMRTNTAYTNGAGTGSGVTFTNAPGASGATGNPTKWIPVDDHGVTRYLPAF